MEESLSKPLDDAAMANINNEQGVVRGLITLGLGSAENTVATGFGLLNDARQEAFAATEATIDYVDKLSRGVVGLGRKTRDRVDSLATDSLKRGQLAVNLVLAALQRTGTSATDFAADAANAAVGERAA